MYVIFLKIDNINLKILKKVYKFIFLFFLCLGCQKEEPRKASHFCPIKEESTSFFQPIRQKEEGSLSFDVMKLPKTFHQSVSCFTNEKIPLRDVIVSSARLLNLNVRVSPNLNDVMPLKMRREPFSHLVQILCQKEDVTCRYVDRVLCIEKDQLSTKTYSLSCLNIERSAQNNMKISTDVFSGGEKKEVEASNSSVSMNSKSNFWSELNGALSTMLPKESFSIHRQAGLVSVKGTSRQHKMVEHYINRLKNMLSSQVLIEAKVVEVNLFETYRSGVEWASLSKNLNINTQNFSRHRDIQDAFSMSVGSGSFAMILHALDHYGETQTLASPSLRVLNNQSAVLKVAKNQVYFRLNYDKQFFSTREQNSVSVSSELHTIPIGLVLLVQPSIDMENGKIMLFLRPTLSRLHDSVNDPAVTIMSERETARVGDGENVASTIPIVDVREIDSVLCVQSGEMAILGGLMDIRSRNDRKQIPLIGDIPILGEAFQHNEKTHDVVELVILLRATIMQS
jgi:MSHA type pilus biogenesis protein MshL